MAATDLNTVRATIESRLEDELKDTPPTPVVFQNSSYKPTPNSSWCQCLVNFGDILRPCFGNKGTFIGLQV